MHKDIFIVKSDRFLNCVMKLVVFEAIIWKYTLINSSKGSYDSSINKDIILSTFSKVSV